MKVSKIMYHVNHIESISEKFINEFVDKEPDDMVEVSVRDITELLDYAEMYKSELLEKNVECCELEN